MEAGVTPETIFTAASSVATVSWLALLLFPFNPRVGRIAGLVVPAALAAVYAILAAAFIWQTDGGFGSLAGVALLFEHPWVLLAGWIHYLAFDLVIGAWEARDAARRGVSRWLLLPCLVLTFMLGPAGWLLYLMVRTTASK
jgi:hypothetical protein